MSAAADDDAAAAAEGERLRRDWSVRIAGDEVLAEASASLLDALGDGGLALATEVARAARDAAAGAGTGTAVAVEASPQARAAGRAAYAHGVTPRALQQALRHLADALCVQLLRTDAGADDALSLGRAARCACRANAAVACASTVAVDAWLDCAKAHEGARDAASERLGRTLRHDIKTPLQAASLNLELLTLESAEQGLDTGALDVIQQSLDRAIEMLRGFEAPGT